VPRGVQQGVQALKHLSQASGGAESEMACSECFQTRDWQRLLCERM